MFIFGHIGFTLGIFYLGNRYYITGNKLPVDYRLVAFGSLLPDFIDKPLGRVILNAEIGSGRIFAHTLLAGIALLCLSYTQYTQKGKQDLKFLLISGASFCHIFEDQIWNNPITFIWPLLGWSFPRDEIQGSFFEYLMVIFSHSYDPAFMQTFVCEIIGLTITLAFVGNYLKSKYLRSEESSKGDYNL